MTTDSKPRGRPRGKKTQNPGKRVPLSFKTTESIRADLDAAANESGRSLAQEVEYRLENSFRDEQQLNLLFKDNELIQRMQEFLELKEAITALFVWKLGYANVWGSQLYNRAIAAIAKMTLGGPEFEDGRSEFDDLLHAIANSSPLQNIAPEGNYIVQRIVNVLAEPPFQPIDENQMPEAEEIETAFEKEEVKAVFDAGSLIGTVAYLRFLEKRNEISELRMSAMEQAANGIGIYPKRGSLAEFLGVLEKPPEAEGNQSDG